MNTETHTVAQVTTYIQEVLEELDKIQYGDVDSVVGWITGKVFEGEQDPIELAGRLRLMQYITKGAEEVIKDQVVQAVMEGSQTANGIQFTKTTAATRYKFDHNDSWTELNDKIKELTAQRKEIEQDMVLANKKGKTIIDEETGEVIAPAIYSSGGQETYSAKKAG